MTQRPSPPRAAPPGEPARCPFCGSAAAVFYDRLRDRLCGTPGEWTLVRCANRRCGLVFLDPAPDESALARAYEVYYTHDEGDPRPDESHGWPRSMFHGVNLALLRASGVLAEQRRVKLSYLDGQPTGRVLEVGCGGGRRLAELRSLGWEVVGQEVDGRAAEVARKAHGLEVLVGPLENLKLPAASFDAVISNHVIEHVREPVKLLAECWRVLGRGGRLVAVTPNVDGFSRHILGRSWRGFEAPRHLHIFSRRTLGILGGRAGIPSARVWTTAANTFIFATRSMDAPDAALTQGRAGAVLAMRVVGAVLQHVAGAVHAIVPSSGDECVLWAVK